MCVAMDHPSFKSQAPYRTSTARLGVRAEWQELREAQIPESYSLSESDLVTHRVCDGEVPSEPRAGCYL